LPWGKEKLIITVRWKEIDIAVRRESLSGGMKSILAMRQRKIDYRREAKRKSISPWGVNRRVGGMKLILAMRQRKINYRREAKKNRYRREAWIAIRRMKSIFDVRQRKIDYRREAKKKLIIPMRRRKNWLSPWGEEKIDYRREAWIAVRRNEIDSCHEAKKKIDYCREAWPQGQRKYRHGWGAAVRPKEYCAKAVQLIRAQTQQANNNQQVFSQESGSPARWPKITL
jgi:hypothetical protein